MSAVFSSVFPEMMQQEGQSTPKRRSSITDHFSNVGQRMRKESGDNHLRQETATAVSKVAAVSDSSEDGGGNSKKRSSFSAHFASKGLQMRASTNHTTSGGEASGMGHREQGVEFVPLADEASPASFAALLASVGVAAPGSNVVNLKGYGSGLQGTEYHSEVLQAIGDAPVVVWEGDWLKADSFTSVIPVWLKADPTRRAVGFRKAEGDRQGFVDSWCAVPEVADQVVTALVSPESVETVEDELRALGTPEADVRNSALGFLAMRASASSKVIAVGGGKTCALEARACLALHALTGRAPAWLVLDVPRISSNNGPERPVRDTA
mmetsp:Transcript_4404/g.9648  ORF Transcript_4404/g.9648 Transcript_4404/m.9648 type:complete len:323 (-) Transcript_4404:160-1128(-)